ncbi:Conserved oligomeric Golgi complex subunit 6 [Vitis vinifera]|uniref:Conserved oligomeric Golgi complex subunit 6 n=1 Tax=Vitis vinifera TaxID=29760 RepID=A0A438EQC6_VITVI|nr:Conserved oligomeric Golgi complex subunit 6 [Vitis vinifera]
MATVGVAPGLSRKLKKVLESRTDSPDLLASLNTLSTFYTENTQHARRNLRSTIEKRCLSINHDFLRASDAAQQALDCVEEEVNALADCCDRLIFIPSHALERETMQINLEAIASIEGLSRLKPHLIEAYSLEVIVLRMLRLKPQIFKRIAKALNSCNATTGDIISTTERLKQELEITTQRQEIASCFLRDYQLSNEEISALREEDLNENFFKALSHVQEIHANCKILLRTHHQSDHSLKKYEEGL